MNELNKIKNLLLKDEQEELYQLKEKVEEVAKTSKTIKIKIVINIGAITFLISDFINASPDLLYLKLPTLPS